MLLDNQHVVDEKERSKNTPGMAYIFAFSYVYILYDADQSSSQASAWSCNVM